jgi:phage shock protein E
MNPTSLLLAPVLFAIAFTLKRRGNISAKAALLHLEKGAVVVDVRSAAEFNSGHLPAALNIPLDEIETTLPQHVKDKDKVLLLHCLSGIRSGAAKRHARRLGYKNVFNLGSLNRAGQIAKRAAATRKGSHPLREI